MDELNKCLFLLGAGVSVGADCKTSGQILEDILSTTKDIDSESELKNKQHAFQDLTRIILASLDYDFRLRNVELGEEYYRANIEDFMKILRKLIYKDHLIPRPLVGNWSDDILRLEIRYKEQIFYDFLNFILDQLKTKWLAFNQTKAVQLLTPLKLLLESIPTTSNIQLEIFTLNYDLLFESVLNEGAETNICNGFDRSGFNSVLFKESSSRINYYKLHGSLDWKRSEEGKVNCSPKHEIQDNPLIIFGEDNKMLSFDPFFSLLVNFRNKLDICDLYIVIGYSFQDAYINNLLLQSVNESQKKLLIIEPYAFGDIHASIDSVNNAFQKRLEVAQKNKEYSGIDNLDWKLSEERFEILRMTAGDFFTNYLSNGAVKLLEYINRLSQEEKPFG